MSTTVGVDGLEITGPMGDRYDEVLTPRALELVALLHRELDGRRLERLQARRDRVQALADGGTLDFLPETAHIREDDSWRVADPAPGLVDRRVEMTGPTDRKMTINALDSGARCWLADQEDANSPLWENVVNGPLDLVDSLDRTIDSTSPQGKRYELRPVGRRPLAVPGDGRGRRVQRLPDPARLRAHAVRTP